MLPAGMQARSDSLDVQINLLKGQIPDQQVFVANEDVALTSEIVIDKPEFIEVEKKTMIKKNCIINEKFVIHKFTGTAIPVDHGQHLSIDASFVGSEFSFPDSQGSSAMEIASQESSLGSVMEICSQESLMEYSSQETNTTTEQVNNKTASSTEVSCDAKFSKENMPLNLPDHPYTEENRNGVVSSTSDKPSVAEDTFSGYQYCDSYEEGEISKGFQEYDDEKDLENEAEYIKEEKSMNKVNDLKRRSSTERLLLAREESVEAREEACIYREKALKKREAAFVNQREMFKECVDNVIPLPKRLKLKKVFKYM